MGATLKGDRWLCTRCGVTLISKGLGFEPHDCPRPEKPIDWKELLKNSPDLEYSGPVTMDDDRKAGTVLTEHGANRVYVRPEIKRPKRRGAL